MEYIILSSKSHHELSLLVTTHLSKGWEIVGGVAVTELRFYQSMIKNK